LGNCLKASRKSDTSVNHRYKIFVLFYLLFRLHFFPARRNDSSLQLHEQPGQTRLESFEFG